jgi:predicted TIM-barrel fold metal-dependent hydrolase
MDAPVSKLNAMHSSIGIARGVVVQSTAEVSDYDLFTQLLQENPRLRGVIRYSDDLSNANLDALHNAGVRGIRFAFARFMKQQRVTKATFLNTVERVRALGWHVKVHVEGPDLLEIEDWLRATNGTLVVDHMAHLRPEEGLEQPALRLLLDLQQGGNVWVGISNFDRWSNEGAPNYSDSLPLARTLIRNAPDRVIWATDWPHPMYRNPHVQNEPPPDAHNLLRFALECADHEANLIKKLLVTNPAALYD